MKTLFESVTSDEGFATLEQSRLNISERSRRSRLPWRGQFSPELVEYLMEVPKDQSTRYFDPFCGSGTVLYEALQRGQAAVGLEVNPAAWHLAVLARFTTFSDPEQQGISKALRSLIGRYSSLPVDHATLAIEFDKSSHEHPFFRLCIAASVVLGMGNGTVLDATAMARGAFSVLGLLNELETRTSIADCFLSDARKSPIESASVDGVITSPPYINVFNYHQNYRPAVELLGWKPLQAALSEIGANRKHRMNRFLTVVQYCIDMRSSLIESARVMRENSPLVIVLGRTSNVLGASFRNGHIIDGLITDTGLFDKPYYASRSFKNRFGETIYEDIFSTRRNSNISQSPDNARDIGVDELRHGRKSVPEKNLPTLEEAIERSGKIQASPLLEISVPDIFSNIPTTRMNESHGSHPNRRAR